MSMTKQEELIDRLYHIIRDDTYDNYELNDVINELYILTFCTRKEVKE